MRQLTIVAPIVALLSSLTTLKVQELRRERELAAHAAGAAARVAEQEAAAAAAGETAEAERARLKASLTAALARSADLEHQLLSVQAEAATAHDASAGTSKSDPIGDMVGALGQLQSLVVDIIMYAGGQDELGRQRLQSPVDAILELVSSGKQRLHAGYAAFQTHFPAVDKQGHVLAEAVAGQLAKVHEHLDVAIGRFIETHPQHKALLRAYPPLTIAGVAILFALLTAANMYWLFIAWVTFVCTCCLCRRRVRRGAQSKPQLAAAAPTLQQAPEEPAAAGEVPTPVHAGEEQEKKSQGGKKKGKKDKA